MNVNMPSTHAAAQSQAAAAGLTREAAVLQTGGAAKAAAEVFQHAAPAQQASEQQVQEAVEKIREFVTPTAQNLQFSVDKDLGRTIVKVMDANTHEVVRQIPSEEVVAISKALDKLQGLLIRQKA